MTRAHPFLGLAAFAALLAAGAVPRAARASRADAFEGKVEPVSGQLYRKAGRFEFTPSYDVSVNDAFYQKRFVGVKLGYHFSEYLALSGQVAGAFSNTFLMGVDPTGSAVVCPSTCRPATAADLYQVPGHLNTVGGLEIEFSPIYGKLNLFAEKVAHLDLSVLAGVDLFVHDKVLSGAQLEANPASKPGTASSVGGHVGFGMRVFLTPTLAARLDFKDYIYAVPVPNMAEGSGGGRDVQNQLFVELGLSAFFPFQNRSLP
jgi:outer membrane beta-barrel protein